MQSLAADAEAIRRRSRRTLWLMFAICAAPIVASFVAYNYWRPTSHVNYGTLLKPRPLPDVELKSLDGKAFRLSELKGEWILLTIASAACDTRCRENLVYMRQVRLAEGKESERIERVWVIGGDSAPSSELLAEHEGLHVARDVQKTIVRSLPAPDDPAAHIYVVDPLGNLMMRFPANPDPRRILKDISRLLRHSQWK
jgi:cytochrome oxidase Cu insertion factor (SCO1/SenC/PrrC family)